MNKITILTAATCLSLVATSLYADDAHHPEKAQKTTDTKAAAAAGAKSVETESATDPQIKRAQETMRKLQDQMGKIRQTNDPKERQKMMQEHMQTLREGMMTLHGMKKMEGGGGQDGMMMGGDMMKGHDMMEMRMDMMEMMMDQMMQREETRASMPAK